MKFTWMTKWFVSESPVLHPAARTAAKWWADQLRDIPDYRPSNRSIAKFEHELARQLSAALDRADKFGVHLGTIDADPQDLLIQAGRETGITINSVVFGSPMGMTIWRKKISVYPGYGEWKSLPIR